MLIYLRTNQDVYYRHARYQASRYAGRHERGGWPETRRCVCSRSLLPHARLIFNSVTNAGGLGVIGGVGYTPDMLREQVAELKGYLNDKNAPFGVDLLIPQVGGSARKTKSVPDNSSYTYIG